MRRLDRRRAAFAAATSRRTFIRTAALGAASLPLLASQGYSQASSRKYRVCEIGHDGDYGHMAGAFAGFPNVTMVAVADPVEKARLQHAARVKAPRTYADFREMLEKEKPDVVGIGPNRKTYSAQRFEMIKAAAEHGAHVMVDKPHARSLDEADQIIALAEKHKIRSVVYHPVRVAPAVVRLKELVDDGLIGDVVEAQVWAVEHLLHMGWHPVYVLRHFAGEPLWCSARVTQGGREITLADARDDPMGRSAGDTAHASYAFAGRLQGHFVWQNQGQGPYQMTLYGSKGVVHFMITDDPQIYHFPDPEWTPRKPGVDWRLISAPKDVKTGAEANVNLLIADLFRAIETDTQTVASFYEARGVLEMLLAIYTSQLKGGRVSFPLKERAHPLGALAR
jgi:predicted dehydrogenase